MSAPIRSTIDPYELDGCRPIPQNILGRVLRPPITQVANPFYLGLNPDYQCHPFGWQEGSSWSYGEMAAGGTLGPYPPRIVVISPAAYMSPADRFDLTTPISQVQATYVSPGLWRSEVVTKTIRPSGPGSLKSLGTTTYILELRVDGDGPGESTVKRITLTHPLADFPAEIVWTINAGWFPEATGADRYVKWYDLTNPDPTAWTTLRHVYFGGWLYRPAPTFGGSSPYPIRMNKLAPFMLTEWEGWISGASDDGVTGDGVYLDGEEWWASSEQPWRAGGDIPGVMVVGSMVQPGGIRCLTVSIDGEFGPVDAEYPSDGPTNPWRGGVHWEAEPPVNNYVDVSWEADCDSDGTKGGGGVTLTAYILYGDTSTATTVRYGHYRARVGYGWYNTVSTLALITDDPDNKPHSGMNPVGTAPGPEMTVFVCGGSGSGSGSGGGGGLTEEECWTLAETLDDLIESFLASQGMEPCEVEYDPGDYTTIIAQVICSRIHTFLTLCDGTEAYDWFVDKWGVP